MAERNNPRYGTPNFEMIRGWLNLPADQDGPFWAVNLMKYREVADYHREDHGEDHTGIGGKPTVSGREADDAYSPLGPLAAIGAVVSFLADVTAQSGSEPGWDRIGIVRYPSRAAFMAMQQREDFKKQHVHKDAGMEFTIVMSCLPVWHSDEQPSVDGSYLMRVSRFADAPATSGPLAGVRPVARFDVEGVIVGDERKWTEVRFDWVDDSVLAELISNSGAEEQFAITLRPIIDKLVTSIVSAPKSS